MNNERSLSLSKASSISPSDLFVSFRFTGAIFLKKTSDEKLKNFVMYFFTKKHEKNVRTLWNFRILAEMLKRKFERTRGNRPRVQQFCSIYLDIRDIEIRDIESFFA